MKRFSTRKHSSDEDKKIEKKRRESKKHFSEEDEMIEKIREGAIIMKVKYIL